MRQQLGRPSEIAGSVYRWAIAGKEKGLPLLRGLAEQGMERERSEKFQDDRH